MSVRLTCPQGHEWEASPDLPQSAPIPCPTCQSLVVLPGPPTTQLRGNGEAPATLVWTGPVAATMPDPALAATMPSSPARAAEKKFPTVPGYQIVAELGRGGMGVVYQARQEGLERLVALKMVLGGGAATSEDVARFRTEAESAARLRHPNIVQIYDIGETDGRPFFSLEFCEGGGLDRKLKGNPLPSAEAAALLETLARAVQHAHENGVIHRDLKPANILLSGDRGTGTGERAAATFIRPAGVSLSRGKETMSRASVLVPKISDFGLAKKLDDQQGQTLSGTILGTPSYMAPEQADGRIEEVGPLADVYALGAILYELLTGRPPFKAAQPLDTVFQVLHDEPVPPSRLQPKMPRDLETICLKCLQKDPRKRYASAEELADDLARFQSDEPILARPVPLWERGWKWAQRHPAITTAISAATLALLTVAIQSLLDNRKLSVALGEARGNLYDAHRTLAWQAWQQADVAQVEELLNGLRPRPGDPDLRDADWYYLDALCHRDRQTLNAAPGGLFALIYAGNSGRLMVAGNDGRVRLWNLGKEQESAIPFEGGSGLSAVAVSPDGTMLAVAAAEHTVFLVETTTGNRRANLSGHTGSVRSLAFSPTSNLLASAAYDGTVRLWDARTGTSQGVLEGHRGGVAVVLFTPDGRTLVSAGQDKIVRLWDVVERRLRSELPGHTDTVHALACTPDGRLLASGANDPVIRLWDLSSGKLDRLLHGHADRVRSLAFAPDGRTLASASQDHTVKLWHVPTRHAQATLKGHRSPVWAVAFSPDGQSLATGSSDGQVKIWDAGLGAARAILSGHRQTIRAARFAPDGRTLATASVDGTVRLWDVPSGTEGGVLPGKQVKVTALAYAPDGRTLAANNEESSVLTLWDPATQEPRQRLRGHGGTVVDASFGPDGHSLVTAGDDRTIRLWDVVSGHERVSLTAPQWFTCVAWSPDGRIIAGGGGGQVLYLWDPSGRPLAELPGHTGTLFCLRFSPDGRTLASGSQDGTVKLWHVERRQELTTLRGHLGPIRCVAFSRDGRYLALSGGEAGRPAEVKVWDLAQRRWRTREREHPGAVYALDFGSGGLLASGDELGVVKVWDQDP